MQAVLEPDEQEWLDLVDSRDRVIGIISRAEAWRTNARWVRVVNAFVVNAKGELWIPKRSASKAMFSLCLDMSVGGHIGVGESYEAAFIRETTEELNLDITKKVYCEIGYLHPAEHGLSAFMKVYELNLEAVPNYNRDDFASAEWVKPSALLERLSNGEPAKGDLEKLVKLFYT